MSRDMRVRSERRTPPLVPTPSNVPLATPPLPRPRPPAAGPPALEALRGRDGFDATLAQAQPQAPAAVAATPAAVQERTLPAPVALNLSASVGDRRSTNTPADVRQVQDRLQQLGYLSEASHTAEQVDASGTQPIATRDMPQTMEALRRFQREVTGQTDGSISPRGITARALADPTYGTQSTINPGAVDATAGVAPTTLPPAVARIVQAVEATETGANAPLSESPALLRNASGTPASFGRSQLIAGTAVGVLSQHPDVARHYGLTPEQVTQLGTLARDTTAAYRDISAQVPANGDTEAGLQRRISEYTTSAAGQDFRERTGLGDTDIANMFRAAQFRAQLTAPAHRNQSHEQLLANPDVAANIQALGMTEADTSAYLRRPANHGENREGFVTRALLSSEHGQTLRNAMTDNGGIPMSRLLIQDNYDQVQSQGQRRLGRPLRADEAAQGTMLAHNQPGALDAFYQSLRQGRPPQVTPYVHDAMRHWSP